MVAKARDRSQLRREIRLVPGWDKCIDVFGGYFEKIYIYIDA